MNRRMRTGWMPLLVPFLVWASHFLLSWAAVEIWPEGVRAWRLGGWFTAGALASLAWQAWCVGLRRPDDELAAWMQRMGQVAIAVAATAVVFVALPTLVLRP